MVRSGLVTASSLDEARVRVQAEGGTLGETLVALGAIDDVALTEFYCQRLLVPKVNPNSLARLTPKVIATIPADMAIELRVIPIALDGENNLTVAMSDPSDSHAVDEVGFFTGSYVVRAVATQMQIAWCLAHYYGHVTQLGAKLLQPAATASTKPDPVVQAAMPARAKGLTGKVEAMRHRAMPPLAKDDATDAAPAAIQRAKTASGEIKIVRAATVKEPLPVEESGPTITVEAEPSIITMEVDEPTDELEPVPLPKPVRKRPIVKEDPPELYARAGEVEAKSREQPIVLPDPEPSILVDTGALVPPPPPELEARIGEIVDREEAEEEAEERAAIRTEIGEEPSQPILLERRRTGEQAPLADDGEVVELARPKTKTPRPEKRTQVGVVPNAAVTRAHRDTAADGVPGALDDRPTEVTAIPDLPDDATLVDTPAAPPRRSLKPTLDDELAPPPPPQKRVDWDAIDDGWGPPGTTIPPPLLGAVPGTEGPTDGAAIPMPDVDSAPLIVARPRDATGATLARALEEATSRVIDLIHHLELAKDRDDIVRLLVEHLAVTHRRAGFFSVKSGELNLFTLTPKPPVMPFATLRLDRPSTLQDVVGTRLPYRGPPHDDASKVFLQTVLGAAPPEILLVPIAIRERVVGVLFAEHRVAHTFDDQLALAARAAGMALEKILRAKRS